MGLTLFCRCAWNARTAVEVGWPVFIPQRIVDIRQRHWMDAERTVPPEDVGSLYDAVPAARIVVTEAAGAGLLMAARYPGIYFESSRVSAGNSVQRAARVVFGTGAPFKGITPALLGLQHPGLSDELRHLWTPA